MFFSIPLANPFSGAASVTVDRQDNPVAGSLQAKIQSQTAFSQLGNAGAVDTVASADTKIDSMLVATGTDT